MKQFIKALDISESVNAANAILQTKVILRSFGLTDEKINEELMKYREKRKT